jgi:DNA-nicking Smr family endonuclease
MAARNKDKVSDSSMLEPGSPFSEPVILSVEDFIDLHAFSPKDIPSVVNEYLEQCCAAGIYEIRLIHGRGKGIQRRIVQALLADHPLVRSFRDASPESGGWGATLAVLRHPVESELG